MSEEQAKYDVSFMADMPRVYADIDHDERSSILLEADEIVNGQRQVDYSDPVESFATISKIASAIIGKEITPIECCKVLMAVKHARQQFKHKRDNLVDLAGYAEILNRLEQAL